MIVWLEGADACGKSTLANKIVQICNTYGWLVNRHGEQRISTNPVKLENGKIIPNDKRVTEEQLYSYFDNMLTDTKKVYILDRGPISDIVYRIYDDYKPVTTITKLLDYLNKHSYSLILIYCTTPNSEELLKERGDWNPKGIQFHKQLKKTYNLLFELLQKERVFNSYLFKYTYTEQEAAKKTLTKICEAINEILNLGV